MRVVLFNPRATRRSRKPRFPTGLGEVCAELHGRFEYRIVDGNLRDAPPAISSLLPKAKGKSVLGISVMPGFQAVGAISVSKEIKSRHAQVNIIWGGFFSSSYPRTILNSGYVDAVAVGQGTATFLETLSALRTREIKELEIPGLMTRDEANGFRFTPRPMGPMSSNEIPYHTFPMKEYLQPTGIGKRTLYYASSMGCTQTCSFCGIKQVYGGARSWYRQPPELVEQQIRKVQAAYGADSVQFVDADQFAEEQWAFELLDRLSALQLAWRGYARVEFMFRQKEDFWHWLKGTGCACLFLGAEGADADELFHMTKTVTVEQTLEVARHCREVEILPEFSYVIGSPRETADTLNATISSIRRLKRICPRSNVIIYFYSGPCRESALSPAHSETALEELVRGDNYNRMVWNSLQHTSLEHRVVRRAVAFRRVLYSRFPKVTDVSRSTVAEWLSKTIAAWRYQLGVYGNPIELECLDRLANISKIE